MELITMKRITSDIRLTSYIRRVRGGDGTLIESAEGDGIAGRGGAG